MDEGRDRAPELCSRAFRLMLSPCEIKQPWQLGGAVLHILGTADPCLHARVLTCMPVLSG